MSKRYFFEPHYGNTNTNIDVLYSNKLAAHLNYRVRLTVDDSRSIVGQFVAFDKHMNMVIADAEEFRKSKN